MNFETRGYGSLALILALLVGVTTLLVYADGAVLHLLVTATAAGAVIGYAVAFLVALFVTVIVVLFDAVVLFVIVFS